MKITEKVEDVRMPMKVIKSGINNFPVNISRKVAINEIVILDDSDDNYNNEDEGDIDNMEGREEVLETRRKWALYHFYALRPAFSVSLILYLSSLTNGKGALTFRSGVVDPIQNLVTLVQMESKAYTGCVQQSTTQTKNRLAELAGEDRQRAKIILKSNREIFRRAEETANDCLHNTQKARESLIRWSADGMDIPWKGVIDTDGGNVIGNASPLIITQNNNCTVMKRNQTEQLLGQDYRATENQVNNAFQDFMSESRNSLKTVSDYAIKRFDYDSNYFIMKRIQPALDYLVEHSVSIQTLGMDLGYNITEIEQLIQEQILAIQHILEQAKQHIGILQERLKEFRVSINALYVNYNELYDRMIKATETVYKFLPPGMSLPDVFDLSDFQIADSFLPPSGLEWPELEIEYSDIHYLFQNTAKVCRNILVKIMNDMQLQSLQGLRRTVQRLSQNLMEILELKDYYPPQFQGSRHDIFDIDHELQLQSLRGQEALNWTARAMIDLRASSSVFENLTTGDITTPTIRRFDHNYTKETSTTFELLDIFVPKFLFLEYMLTKIALLSDYAFLLDILCGFIQWWKLSSMYEKGAMPNMPQVDYGDGDQDASERPRPNYKIILLIAKSFMNPVFVGFLCIFSFIAFLVILFWIPHVQQMCVHSTNGTWLANNMLGPALTNIAMTEGNAQYMLAEHFCYSSQNQLCARVSMEFETQILADKTALLNLQAQHNHSIEALKLMEECVDTSNMTIMVIESCCGLKGHQIVGCVSHTDYTCPIDFSTSPPSAYRPFATYLESTSCSEHIDEWILKDEEHECTSLKEACYRIPCDGVNDEWILTVTNQTDCMVELWFIRSCQFWAAAVLQFNALYVISSLIYLGCRDLNWRKISPDSIGLQTRLLENGRLVKGDNVRERSERISNEIQWFEHKAILQVSLGVLLLTIYIVVVVTLIAKS